MLLKNAVRSMVGFIQAFSLLCLSVFSLGQSGSASPATSSDSSTISPVIVIGFMGGFVKHANAVHRGVQLAAHLRQDYASGVYVEVFENRRREKARQEILRLLSKNHDGTLTTEEKQNARVIIYGMSWGASETVTLERELERDGIPVLLTVQVDSISKIRQNDAVIPANVAEAANFYQPSGLLHV